MTLTSTPGARKRHFRESLSGSWRGMVHTVQQRTSSVLDTRLYLVPQGLR
jgi:hypothetical protein